MLRHDAERHGTKPRDTGRIWLLTVVLVAACTNAPAFAQSSPCTSAAACGDTLPLATGGNIRYYRSLPLTRNESVRRAVVVIHGNGRNAGDYFEYAIAAARLEHGLNDALVLAPHFRTRDDRPSANEHYWSSHGWKIGNKSRDSRRVSSFSVMDRLLALLCPAGSPMFPNIRTVVIAGHSAGGQFVNRYLAGGSGCPNAAVETRYLVMNPSSYLYVDERRRSMPSGPFTAPRTGCRTYDDYKYGLRELNSYMRRVGTDEIRRRLFTRRAWYLAGEADTATGRSLDQRCEAELQGPNRLVRHANYRDYAGQFEKWTGSVFVTIPGIGHSGRRMLASEPARVIAFR